MELTRHGSYRNHVLSVLFGIFVGVSLTLLTSYEGCVDDEYPATAAATVSNHTDSDMEMGAVSPRLMASKSAVVERLKDNESELKEIKRLLLKLNSTKPFHQKEDDVSVVDSTVADELKEKVRVLCFVMTTPDQHLWKAIHAKNTWGPRCNEFLIMSTERDNNIGTIALNSTSGEWGKIKEAFAYIHRYHMHNIDWVLKVEDDTYVVVENLRYMLYPYTSTDSIIFGYKKQSPDIRQGYMSKKAYAISKAAINKIVEVGSVDAEKCRPDDQGGEEYELGKCLENLQVYAGDSRDEKGKGRFFPRDPESHISPEKPTDPERYYPEEDGQDCLSEYAVSFSEVPTDRFYSFDYLLYHLRPYGIVHYPVPLPKKVHFSEIVVKLRSEYPMTTTTTTTTTTTPTPTSTTTTTTASPSSSDATKEASTGEPSTSKQMTETDNSSVGKSNEPSQTTSMTKPKKNKKASESS